MKGTYRDWGLLWFYSVTPGKCWGNVMCYFWPSGFDIYIFLCLSNSYIAINMTVVSNAGTAYVCVY